MHLQAWKEKWEGSADWDIRHWDELWPRLSEFAVRLRRAVARRFHDLLPFLKMCALVHPCKHTEGILADDDFRVKLANMHGEGFGLAEGAGGLALQELAHRLRNDEVLQPADYKILKGKNGLMDWYNAKAEGPWDVVSNGAERNMFVFASKILCILFTNAVTESELSIQNALVGGKGGKRGNLSVENRRNLACMRSGGNAVDYATAGVPLSFDENLLMGAPPAVPRR
jgi:hypothetical protein